MSSLLPKYIGIVRRKTNAQLLAWQGFNFLKFFSLLLLGIGLVQLRGEGAEVKIFEQLVLISSACSYFFISGFGQNALPFFESEAIENKEVFFKSLSALFIVFGTLSSLGTFLYGTAEDLPEKELLLFTAFTFISIPTYAMESYFLANHKQLKLFFWGILSYGMQVPFLLLPIYFGAELSDALLALLIVAVLKAIVCFYFLGLPYHKKLLSQAGRFLKSAAPVILSFVIGGSFVYLNQFIVEEKLSDKEFLMYRYGAREFPFFLIIANSFSLVYSAKITQFFKRDRLNDGLSEFRQKSAKVMHQLFPVAIVLLVLSKPLFTWAYDDQLGAGISLVFNTQLFLLCSRVLFPQTILFGTQQNNSFILASSIELFLGLGLSLLLIEDYGLIGVSLAMVVAYLVEKLILVAVCYSKKIPFFKFFPTLLFSGYSTLLVVVYCFYYGFF